MKPKTLLEIAGTAGALAGGYLFSIAPRQGKGGELEPFRRTYIAHRGFFNNVDIPENSIPAFRRAVDRGFGIELDVQMTTDDRLMVFHDESVKRMCGVDRKLTQMSSDEARALKLGDTDAQIPFFEEVLATIGGKVPLIVEMKYEGRSIEATAKTVDLLRSYDGPFCMESFDPRICAWLKDHAPEIVRGQLASDFMRGESNLPYPLRFLMSNLMLNFLSRPDFIAYNHLYADQPSFKLCRKLFHPVCVAWTIKSEEELERAERIFDIIIFDSFDPKGES